MTKFTSVTIDRKKEKQFTIAHLQVHSFHLIKILSIAANINEVVLVHYPNILLTERAVITEKYQTEVLTVKV